MNKRIIAIARKEFLHVLRDPRSLMLTIGLPIIMLFLFGYAITLDIDNVLMSVCDLDKSEKSRDLIQTFTSSGYFKVWAYTDNQADINLFLDRADCKVGIIIPAGFSKNLTKGNPEKIQALVDGTESNSANIIISYINSITYLFSTKITINYLNKMGVSNREMAGIEASIKSYYNPEMKSKNFIVPGLIAIIMAIIMTILTSLTVVREKEKGTLEQLIVTPIKPFELMVGKIIPYWIIGLFDMMLVVFVGTIFFGVPLKGSFLLLLFTSGIFAITALGVGLLISTVANSQQLANQLSMIISLLPAFILSGFMFPIKSMPEILQYVTILIPAKYFLIILRGIFLKGNGIMALSSEILILLVFGIILIRIASVKFVKKLG